MGPGRITGRLDDTAMIWHHILLLWCQNGELTCGLDALTDHTWISDFQAAVIIGAVADTLRHEWCYSRVHRICVLGP